MSDEAKGNGNAAAIGRFIRELLPLLFAGAMSAGGGYAAVSSRLAVLEERLTTMRQDLIRVESESKQSDRDHDQRLRGLEIHH